jgi:O-antigen/teichoic acid export membrane protein
MSEPRTISKNITQTFIVQIPNYILGVVAGIFLTRHLGPHGKGIYTLLLTNVQLLVMFLGLNLPGAIQYFMANKKIDAARLKGLSLLLLLVGSVLVFAFLFLIPGGGEAFLTKDYDTFYFRCYIFISFFITNFNALLTGFLQGNHNFKSVNRLSLINSVLNFVLFTSLYYAAQYNLIKAELAEVLALTVLVLVVNTVVLLISFQKFIKIKWGLHISAEDLKPLFKFLIPAYISVLVNFFNYRLTIWLVNYYEGTENLGYFSLALNFAQMMLMVTIAINTVLFPYFASKTDFESAVKDFSFALKINMGLMLGATLGLVLFSSFLIPLFYGEVFNPSIGAVKILAVGTFFCSQAQVFGHFLGARNKNWVNTIIYAIALTCLGVLGVILVPIYGIEGAAFASGASYFVMFTIFCIFVKVKYNVGLRSLFTISKSDIQRAKGILSRITKKN